MIKRILSHLIFVILVIFLFNALDFFFDRVIFRAAFTFDTLSNIILPAVIAVLVIIFVRLYKKFVK